MTVGQEKLRIAYITAGAAGMYCGSCLRDNTLVRALRRQQIEAALIPTYTPITTDEPDQSESQVFLSGLDVYFSEAVPLYRYLPSRLRQAINRPSVLAWIAASASGTSPAMLGRMTLSILQGSQGVQRNETKRLVDWLHEHFRPDLINLTNVLIAGCVPDLKRELQVPIVVTLQGDDIFLESLLKKHRDEAIELIGKVGEHVDAFIVFSRYYAEFMSEYLRLPAAKMHVLPLGIESEDLCRRNPANESADLANSGRQKRSIGYLARLAPEKGLHLLVEAFAILKQMGNFDDVTLDIAGWLGKQHHAYAQEQFQRLDQSGLGSHYRYRGTINRQEKAEFLSDISILSVPTIYREPKGLFVLEALAAGVPVVVPQHGAFPELIEDTAGGLLCRPNDPDHLAEQLALLLQDGTQRQQLGQAGQESVLGKRTANHMAQHTLRLYEQLLSLRTT